MEYWITIKGEKHGPTQEWDIKKKIANQTLSPQDLVWHAGLDMWQKLEHHPNFKNAFITPPLAIEPVAIVTTPQQSIPDTVSEVGQHYWGRRLIAKIFDLTLYLLLFFIITNACDIRFGLDLKLSWMRFFYLIPFIMLESFLIQNYQSTPGKALFGLKVVPQEKDMPVSLSRAFSRSLGSWFVGMWLGFFPFFVISGLFTYFSTKKKGATRWDAFSEMTIKGPEKVSFLHVAKFISAIFLILFMFSLYLNIDTDTLRAIEQFNLETYEQLIKIEPKFKPFLKTPMTNE